jgi:hypothetical protein
MLQLAPLQRSLLPQAVGHDLELLSYLNYDFKPSMQHEAPACLPLFVAVLFGCLNNNFNTGWMDGWMAPVAGSAWRADTLIISHRQCCW